MAITPKKVDFSTINEVVNGGGISPEQINAPLQASAYAQELAKNQPDISEANGSGDASVEIIETNGKPQFKFKNIKGEKGESGTITPEDLPISAGNNVTLLQSNGKLVIDVSPDTPTYMYESDGKRRGMEIGSNGIFYNVNQIETEYESGLVTSNLAISKIIPIVAGNNVEFEHDTDNQTVKIHASGGTDKYFEPFNGTGYNASYTVDTNLVTFTLPKTYTQFENKAEYFSVGLRFNLYDDTNARIGTVVTPYFDTRIDSVEPTYAVDNFVVRSMATLNGTEDQQKTFRVQCFVVSDDDEQTVVAFKLFSPTYTTLVDPSAMYNPSFALTQTKAWYKE